MTYISTRAALLEELSKARAVSATGVDQVGTRPGDQPVQSLSAPVRKVTVPTFSGEQREWEHFKGMFEAVIIKDQRIAPIVKLEHLISSCTGKAGQVLKGVQISAADFKVAWDKLLRRYDGSKRRLHNHLQALIDLPLVKNASTDLSDLIDKAEEAVKGLETLHCPIEQYNHWLVYLIVKKLDSETRDSWNIHEEKVEGFSLYKDLLIFLENRVSSLLDTSEVANPSSIPSPQVNKKGGQKVSTHLSQDDSKPAKLNCIFCSGTNHKIFKCFQFLNLPTSKRIEFMNTHKRCVNCFAIGHKSAECNSRLKCLVGGCGQRHNSLLHLDGKQSVRSHKATVDLGASEPSETSMPEEDGVASTTQTHCTYSNQAVLLATAKINLKNEYGASLTAHALIDHGSMRSFISKRIASALNLTRFPTDVTVRGIGNQPMAAPNEFCRVFLSSHSNSNLNMPFQALVLGQLTSKLPSREVSPTDWPHINNLTLADPEFRTPKQIDCILGADVYAQIVLPGIKRGPVGTPLAQQTVLGWLLTGATLQDSSDCKQPHIGFCTDSFHVSEDTQIADSLSQLWETEKIPTQKFLTDEEQQCEQHYCQTFFRQDGRFGVRLPFKSQPFFPGSKVIALKAWDRTAKRLLKDPERKLAYDTFMLEYLALGHMEEIPSRELDKESVYYIPHHAVFHHNKIRVVFNASVPAFNGLSLNDTLHKGEKLQQDLVLVLIKWRFFRFVFTCDMVKMYRQILMHPDDRDWLRIIYDFGQGIRFLRLLTVTYGTTPAPFQSLRTLKQLRLEYKLSAQIIMMLEELSYIDDFFGGADTLTEAIRLKDELIATLALAKIELSKWSANDKALLCDVQCDQRDKPLELPERINTLGLSWSPKTDSYSYLAQPFQCRKGPVTKRQVLSEASKFFDPLGWLHPLLIQFKIFLQDLWLEGLDWDTTLSVKLLQVWTDLKAQVEDLETIQIPRGLGCCTGTAWSLHGFADASKRAFTACVFFVPHSGPPHLIAAKAKVAPVKTLSVTKLELSACHLLAKFIEYLLPSFVVPPQSIHCWSDARNVLCLLKISPAKLKVFEANRVSEIISILPTVRWKYTPTDHNPADCATRGLSAAALSSFDLWWAGPTWLQCEKDWPGQLDLDSAGPTQLSAHIRESFEPPQCWLNRFSSFSRLIRVVARIRRWLGYKRSNPNPLKSLTSTELHLAAERVIQWDQQIHFNSEVKNLHDKRSIPPKSPLAPLNPFLDIQGLARVGSRLSNCSFLTYNEKFPIILARQSLVARMLVRDYHRLCLHGGPQLTLSTLSRKYYIICGKRVVKSILTKCTTCIRYSGRCLDQQMAALPRERVEFEHPFTCTGVDYAGPFKIRPSKGRGIASLKGYLCVFVCFVTRAGHLEVVSDLTTQAFVAAFERFCNRRGLPGRVYSDNGSTFQGAEREIRELFAESSPYFQAIKDFGSSQGVEWSFSPPYGPHFGGIWEAAVKSFKHHFKRVVGETSLTIEEMFTLSAQVEGCLNSRPLCPLSTDGRDPIALTPSHFLIGRPLRTLPPSSAISDPARTYHQRWMLVTAMKNSFWNTWKKDVFHHLIQRNKWRFPQRNLRVGDIVLLKEENSPPATWPLGRITEIHPNRSGLVRVVTVNTAKSTYTRPIQRLIYLPVDDDAVRGYHSHLTYVGLLSDWTGPELENVTP